MRLGIASNTVRSELATSEPPKCERAPQGSLVYTYEMEISQLLAGYPTAPAAEIAEQIDWPLSVSVLGGPRASDPPRVPRVDPADRFEHMVSTSALGVPRTIDQQWFGVPRIHGIRQRVGVAATCRHSGQCQRPDTDLASAGYSVSVSSDLTRSDDSASSGSAMKGLWVETRIDGTRVPTVLVSKRHDMGAGISHRAEFGTLGVSDAHGQQTAVTGYHPGEGGRQ